MQIPIVQPIDIGNLIRAVRKAHSLRQDDAAGAAGVSDVFLGSLEKGAPGARLDNVLKVLKELGIALYADMPESVAVHYAALRQIKKPPMKKPRASS